jgi:Domain of unknown function (DUF4365)
MSDELLSIQDRQEALSRAYAAVIAAGAGYATYAPDFDRDSIDLGFSAGGRMRPNLHVQLKATINLRKAGDHFKFLLKKKNYDDLRAPTQVPRVLVVLALPKKRGGVAECVSQAAGCEALRVLAFAAGQPRTSRRAAVDHGCVAGS